MDNKSKYDSLFDTEDVNSAFNQIKDTIGAKHLDNMMETSSDQMMELFVKFAKCSNFPEFQSVIDNNMGFIIEMNSALATSRLMLYATKVQKKEKNNG